MYPEILLRSIWILRVFQTFKQLILSIEIRLTTGVEIVAIISFVQRIYYIILCSSQPVLCFRSVVGRANQIIYVHYNKW